MLIAVVLVVGLVLLYWFVYRVLPKVSGQISAPISTQAKVTRDSLGVPHIQAGSIEDALFLQGYVTAQDRLWQMDALRRFAAGELSEIVGPATLDADRESRRLRTRRLAEEHYKNLAPEDRVWLTAYARGINHFIETHRDQLPIEFTLLKYDPRPWSVVDTILVGIHMFRDLTTSWREEIQKRDMLAAGEPALVNYLFPVRTGGEAQPGSNAWALSGKRTATGKAMLANDPHLEFGLPSTWYMIHLQAPGLNVSGASLPGAPSVIIGHNDRIAWGMTNLHFDVQDFYAEQINLQTGAYLFQGHAEQARGERDEILVKGGKPVEFANWVTRHGPIWSNDNNQILALRWVAAEQGVFTFPFVELNRARNWEDFQHALARFNGPAQNFIYADVDGNIGYHAAGKLPIRRNYNGDVPVDGSSGEFEWDGFIPFEELPAVYNPESGLIVTANQNPFPADYKYRVSGNFGPFYRSKEIRDYLSSRAAWKPEEMITVQKDVYSAFNRFLAKQVLGAYDKHGGHSATLDEAANVLRSWNGQMENEQAAPVLLGIVYQHLKQAIVERAAPGKSALYESTMAPPVVEKLLSERPQGWFLDYDQVVLRAFLDAVEEGRRSQGRKIGNWNYGEYNKLTIQHPIIGRIRWIGDYFNIGPVPMSGSPTTIKQITRRGARMIGPSMRMVADTSDWDRSLQNITIGESGQILSSHYKDQWEAYYTGHSFPMRFNKYDGDVLMFVPGGR